MHPPKKMLVVVVRMENFKSWPLPLRTRVSFARKENGSLTSPQFARIVVWGRIKIQQRRHRLRASRVLQESGQLTQEEFGLPLANFVLRVPRVRQPLTSCVLSAWMASTKTKLQSHRLCVRRVVKGSMHPPKKMLVVFARMENFKSWPLPLHTRVNFVLRVPRVRQPNHSCVSAALVASTKTKPQ